MDARRYFLAVPRWLVLAAGALVLAGLGLALACPVPTDQAALVLRFGQPVRVINGGPVRTPGFALRLPFAEQVVWLDRRLLTVAVDAVPVTTRDNQRLAVDAYAIWQVRDPLRFYQALGTPDEARGALQAILASVVRQHGARDERGLRAAFDREIAGYGAQATDARVSRVALPEGAPLDAALARMTTGAQAEAAAIAAEGHRDAQVIRADAEARADRIFAASFGKDPQFHDFYRAMQSYDAVFAQKGSRTTIVLSPDSAYLQQFRGN